MTDSENLNLAREWAEYVREAPSDYSEIAVAAADLISSLPDQWVDTEKLREVVADHHIDMSEELMEALGALLPTPTPPTLADMAPEERAECQWMQADLKGNRIIIGAIADGGVNYMKQDGKAHWDSLGSGAGEIVPLPDLPRMEWPGSEPEDGTTVADSENVSHGQPEPQLGEAWLVDYGDGQTVALLGKVNPADDEPTWFTDDGGGYSCDWGNPVARLVPETTEQNDSE